MTTVFDRLAASRPWTEDERIVIAQMRRLAEEVLAPKAGEFDRRGAFPWANVEALNGLGLNAIFVPEAYGGAPARYRLYIECVRLLAQACAATGIIYATNFHAMKPVIDFAEEALKARILPRIAGGALAAIAITEASAGSDATRMKTRFTPDAGEVVVDGAKLFITNGDVADLILVFGKWSEIEDDRTAITALVVEKGTPGFEVLRTETKMGLRASSTAAIAFDGCRVPRANLVGAPGKGLAILLASLNLSRPSVAAHALGIAAAAFEDMTKYINQRNQSGRRIIDFQANQFLLADLASEMALVECWIDRVAAMIDAGARDFGIEASIAKLRASDLAMRMTTEAVQMHGGYGYCGDYRVERLMRDAKITQIWEGTNQIHRQLIGRSFRWR